MQGIKFSVTTMDCHHLDSREAMYEISVDLMGKKSEEGRVLRDLGIVLPGDSS